MKKRLFQKEIYGKNLNTTFLDKIFNSIIILSIMLSVYPKSVLFCTDLPPVWSQFICKFYGELG